MSFHSHQNIPSTEVRHSLDAFRFVDRGSQCSRFTVPLRSPPSKTKQNDTPRKALPLLMHFRYDGPVRFST